MLKRVDFNFRFYLLLRSKSMLNIYGILLQNIFNTTASHIIYEIFIKQRFILLKFLYNVQIIRFENQYIKYWIRTKVLSA